MRVEKIQLTTFRNLDELEIVVPKADKGQIVALVGPNGIGKTSVLESLSLLSPGRGLHKAKPDNMSRHGAQGWGIFTQISCSQGAKKRKKAQQDALADHTVGQAFRGKERRLKIDGVDAPKQSALATLGNVLWLTPREDRLFLEGPAARRNFFDRLVYGVTPDHAVVLNAYRHHARARLQLLRQNAAADWLALEEQQAAQAGVAVLRNRLAYMEALLPYLLDVSLTLAGATLSIFEEEDPVAALAGKFERSRIRDAEVGATHTGPQKVDVVGTLDVGGHSIPLPETSSGQHKRALVHIILAHARLVTEATGQPPLVLIDEVAAHLDEQRREDVLQALLKLGAQIWVTETEVERLGRMADKAEVVHLASVGGVMAA
jgi:DNA replication and repair protein RecF